jgi:hypothetical protein
MTIPQTQFARVPFLLCFRILGPVHSTLRTSILNLGQVLMLVCSHTSHIWQPTLAFVFLLILLESWLLALLFFVGTQSVPLINPPPGGRTTALGGFLTALDLDGNILWQTANPYPAILPVVFTLSPIATFAALNVGPVTVANNVVYWPSYDPQGNLIFVDARTGQILGNFATGVPIGNLEGGASVVDGSVYVGSGFGIGIGLPGLWYVWGLTPR